MESSAHPSRRSLLAAASVVAFGTTAAAEPEPPPSDAATARQRLQDGNRRFVAGQTRHAHQGAEWRKHLVAGQQPFATVLGCSDSRVPIELVFDQGFGDLFVIRVAGNVVSRAVVGSLEYAVEHLQTKLLLVLGHQGCGAVTAALQELERPVRELPGLRSLLQLIEPGLPRAGFPGSAEERVAAAVEANVRYGLKQLSELPELKPALAQNRVELAGGIYDLHTGQVRFLR